MSGFQMVSSTIDGITTLFTIGGYSEGPLSDIFRLECLGSGTVASSCTWKKYDKFELQVPRRYHAVIPLSDNFAHKICKSGMSGITSQRFLFLKTVFKITYTSLDLKLCIFLFSMSSWRRYILPHLSRWIF